MEKESEATRTVVARFCTFLFYSLWFFSFLTIYVNIINRKQAHAPDEPRGSRVNNPSRAGALARGKKKRFRPRRKRKRNQGRQRKREIDTKAEKESERARRNQMSVGAHKKSNAPKKKATGLPNNASLDHDHRLVH